jgi:hypothetical protein
MRNEVPSMSAAVANRPIRAMVHFSFLARNKYNHVIDSL